MIDLVLPEARYRFAAALMEMHSDRKQVFVDRLGWSLPARGSWLEVDQFDNDFAVYLLALDGGRHRGSVRLLPSTGPNMLDSLFPELCPDGAPAGDEIWEISRLVTSPREASGASVLKLHRLLALALIEFARLNDIRRYNLVAEARRVPALLAVGWDVVPLGLPTRCASEDLQALQVRVEDDTLERVRARVRVWHPVLQVREDRKWAA
ncbi:MAG TPA: acyl-homoserine-lactone synthase [Allosphingosinicella sp.]|nr:acyl-homoserine-lactone synthase [Allosphingosinicella sp.]